MPRWPGARGGTMPSCWSNMPGAANCSVFWIRGWSWSSACPRRGGCAGRSTSIRWISSEWRFLGRLRDRRTSTASPPCAARFTRHPDLKTELEELRARALERLQGELLRAPVERSAIVVERTRDAQHGDFSCNIALRLAKSAGHRPAELAAAIVAALPPSPLLSRAEGAGAGFINLYLAGNAQRDALRRVFEQGARYGTSQAGAGARVIVEFVSANPTGPLHVGHGRQATYGATLAKLLQATGHSVHREYYINDAGRQVDILAVSVWVRYLQAGGVELPFPVNGYRADYVQGIATRLHAQRGPALQRPAAAVLAGLPADAAAGEPEATAGEQKERYIDALIARMRELLAPAAYQEG